MLLGLLRTDLFLILVFFHNYEKTQRWEAWIFLHSDGNIWHFTYQVGRCVMRLRMVG